MILESLPDGDLSFKQKTIYLEIPVYSFCLFKAPASPQLPSLLPPCNLFRPYLPTASDIPFLMCLQPLPTLCPQKQTDNHSAATHPHCLICRTMQMPSTSSMSRRQLKKLAFAQQTSYKQSSLIPSSARCACMKHAFSRS